MDAAPASGTAAVTRPTVLPRPLVAPLLHDREAAGHRPDDPAVRRYWSAAIGPGAVVDLLRLVAAAHAGRRLREPIHLPTLVTEGLAHRDGDVVLVRPHIPHLGPRHLQRIHPSLRGEYLRLTESV